MPVKKPKKMVPRAPRPSRPPRDDVDAAEVLADYLTGCSLEFLGMKYGCSDATIRRRIIAAGGAMDIRPCGNPWKIRK